MGADTGGVAACVCNIRLANFTIVCTHFQLSDLFGQFTAFQI